jgi:Ca-activated chloride channel homolog
MTQFTSFVAVEETIITEGGESRRIEVPVEMPDGVSYRGVFGDVSRANTSSLQMARVPVGKGVGGVSFLPRQMSEAPAAIDSAAAALTPQEIAKAQSRLKMHPAIAALVERLRTSGTRPAALEAAFIRDGKAEIQVWLTDTNATVLTELKRLGFEVMLGPKSGNLLIGRLPVGNLSALVDLAAVRYVSPLGLER